MTTTTTTGAAGPLRTLEWSDLRKIGRTDSAGRWYPAADIAEYFGPIRAPSRAWPHSYARAAQTQRFARWLLTNHPATARQCGLDR